MRAGIVTRNKDAYSSARLRQALAKRGIEHTCFSFPQLIARVAYKPCFTLERTDLTERLGTLLIRPVGRGSLEELVFRMDMLYRLQRLGTCIVNPPEAIEHCVDKYDILTILEENGIPVPRTVVTENVREALDAFEELGGDIVVKPLFGSRGVGATRVNDAEVASTIFKAIAFQHGVVYIQEFVQHGCSDIRAFVVGNRAVAAMSRVAGDWKTNCSQGARPEPLKLGKSAEDLAVRSAASVECKVAGVDILESPSGTFVVDVNSQPGWKGLQSVSHVDIADEIVEYVVNEARK